jgi:hypothetical protein
MTIPAKLVDVISFSCFRGHYLLTYNKTAIDNYNTNDLDVILHDFLLQIIYTMIFRVKLLNNLQLHGSDKTYVPGFKYCENLFQPIYTD